MNQIPVAERAKILHHICEGTSLRATSRLTGFSLNTVTKLVVEVGESAAWFQDQYLINLQLDELQLDEIWAFVGCKDKNKDRAENEHPGSVWTWTAICPKTKLIPSWHLGGRTNEDAEAFSFDLASRIRSGSIHISSDGLPAYGVTIPEAFQKEHDLMFGQLVKHYSRGEDGKGRQTMVHAERVSVFGNPDKSKISTSIVERQNLTIRMNCRRFTRKTNAFSKKFENHAAALGLHFFYYNFIRKHMTLKTTPAVAAGVVDRVWSLQDLLDMHDKYRAKFHPINRPKTYKSKWAGFAGVN